MATIAMTRRDLVGAGLAGGAALLLPLPAGAARRKARSLARSGAFPLGVASGLPTQQGITLWTKVAGLETTERVAVEVARDPDFRRVVHRQGVLATADHAHVAKTRVTTRKLRPGEEYFYRFETATTSSPAGRFRTARPADSQEPLRIGFFSCQQYQSGYYVAHRALAQEDCDVVVCLGDYIYETDGDKGLPGRADRTSRAGNGQCELLAEYRDKYALYRSDPDLQAMHASAAFLATWDDHEVENNHAGESEGTTDERRIPYAERKRNAYAAWFEHMPTERFPRDPDRIYRRVRLGGLADLLLLDLRRFRDAQPCGDEVGVPCPTAGDPGRTMLGARQEAWLKTNLEASTAAWKVLGSSVEMMAWDIAPTQGVNPDGWDGYSAERRELLTHLQHKGVKDVSVLTGDIHLFVAGNVTTDGRATGTPVATEFVGGSVTSQSLDEFGPLGQLANANIATNPHWKYAEFTRRGYGVMDVTPQELRVAFRSPTDVTDPDAPVETLARFRVERGHADVERVSA